METASDTRTNVINKHETGFPGYLDFRKLRQKGIEYLGKLSGHIWTDHNVHDPGITILELLVYALMDLGYRTHLPIEDLLAPPPGTPTGHQKNFFTPAEILACNPTTVLDYRKLIMDIPGVRNAWLYDLAGVTGNTGTLRGIYQVYVDLEDEQMDRERAIGEVRSVLNRHRNLCEDFAYHILILCKQPVGINARIELTGDRNAEEVYVDVIQALRRAITPSPSFYTLRQLLEKKRTIGEIFAGRPMDPEQSHGFIDTAELEKIRLKKELHSSDLVNLASKIPGVRRIENLGFNNCGQPGVETHGKFRLRKDHVAEFDVSCSDIRFTRNGIPVHFDRDKYLPLFKLSFGNSGKVLHRSPSPYLDLAIPGGNYRPGLGDYYSIQNEFPHVYGIGDGGLQEDDSDRRRAQSLQLKAYLLFYDQLLANYLSQLANARTLFSVSAQQAPGRSYFAHALKNVPDFEKLLKLHTGNDGPGSAGDEEPILVFPVSRAEIAALAEGNELQLLDPDQTDPLYWNSENACRTALEQAKLDIRSGNYEILYVSKNENCYFFYLLTSSRDFALLSHSTYPDLVSARNDADTLKFAGNLERNSKTWYLARLDRWSFHLQCRPEGYLETLGQLLEKREDFHARRQEFLDHLLSRFAERFTDYARLSFSFYSEKALQAGDMMAREQFLEQYPRLSSGRGKGYDYRIDGWHNENISGAELRFKALAGIEPLKRRHLNNFDLFHYPVYKYVEISTGHRNYFRAPGLFEKDAEAVKAAKQVVKAMQNRDKYRSLGKEGKGRYELVLFHAGDHPAHYSRVFDTEEEAWKEADYLSYIFNPAPVPEESEDVIETGYRYHFHLEDSTDTLLKSGREYSDSKEELKTRLDDSIGAIDDSKRWEFETKKRKNPGRLRKVHSGEKETVYLDMDAFRVDINDTIVGKPGWFTFEALDRKNSFKLVSKLEFRTERQARSGFENLLLRLADVGSFRIEKIRNQDAFRIVVLDKSKIIAENAVTFAAREAAGDELRKIRQVIDPHVYHVKINPEANRFRWVYHLAKARDPSLDFTSNEEFNNRREAAGALTLFRKNIAGARLRAEGNLLLVETYPENKGGGKTGPIAATLRTDQGKEVKATSVDSFRKSAAPYLEEQVAAAPYVYGSAPVEERSIHIDPMGRRGTVAYQLIDKDHPLARVTGNRNQESVPGGEEAVEFLRKKNPSTYHYLQICQGGDIIRKRKVAKNTYRYHFRIICRNRSYRPGTDLEKGLILFESVTGYTGPGEAESAFHSLYLEILQKAEDPDNYGPGKYISPTEVYRSSGDESPGDPPVVFVPEDTREFLGESHEYPLQKIIAEARSFPFLRMKDENGAYRYQFRLQIGDSGMDKWVSIPSYETLKEAAKAFQFFLTLLEYPPNIVEEPDDNCIDRIIIREVLLESRERFQEGDEARAWGPEGVEQLIAVSQSSGAFHRFQLASCYRFFVACNQLRLVHPVKYPTAEERDRQKALLAKSARSYKGIYRELTAALGFTEDPGVKKYAGATPSFDLKTGDELSTGDPDLTSLFHDLRRTELHAEGDELRYLKEGKDWVRLVPGKEFKGKTDAFKKHITRMAHLYPLTREKTETGKAGYRISIRMPGTGHADSNWQPGGPCEESIPWTACLPVWESACVYETEQLAWEAYSKAIMIIGNTAHYLDTYDCDCASYGIEVYQFSGTESGGDDLFPGMFTPEEILAYSPQCYKNAETACEAIQRAKRLINSEGLHLVEHILLRDSDVLKKPRPVPEDLRGCEFEWYVEDEDPCEQLDPEYFIPGRDPYSFIATAVLPAWTGRFRTSENKEFIEHMLYREVPSHILLRILWLGPHDLYRFEKEYKKWLRMRPGKEQCMKRYTAPDLLTFLTEGPFQPYGRAAGCPTCDERDHGRGKRTEVHLPSGPFTGQIDHYNHWQVPESQSNDRFAFLNSRLASYKDKLKDLHERAGDAPVMHRFSGLLSENDPGTYSLTARIDELAERMDPHHKEHLRLSGEEVHALAGTMTGFYLDKLVAGHDQGLDWKKLEASVNRAEIKGSFRRLTMRGVDMDRILEDWRNSGVNRFYSVHDINKLIDILL